MISASVEKPIQLLHKLGKAVCVVQTRLLSLMHRFPMWVHDQTAGSVPLGAGLALTTGLAMSGSGMPDWVNSQFETIPLMGVIGSGVTDCINGALCRKTRRPKDKRSSKGIKVSGARNADDCQSDRR